MVGFQAVMARAKHMQINRVVVYRATGSDGTPNNASCLTTNAVATGTGVDGECNIYSDTQIQSLGATYTVHFQGSSAGGADPDLNCVRANWDHWWCPPSRNPDQGDPPDYLGV